MLMVCVCVSGWQQERSLHICLVDRAGVGVVDINIVAGRQHMLGPMNICG